MEEVDKFLLDVDVIVESFSEESVFVSSEELAVRVMFVDKQLESIVLGSGLGVDVI